MNLDYITLFIFYIDFFRFFWVFSISCRFVEGDFSKSNNVADLGEEERTYISDIKLKVLGYLMGEGVNDPKPKITMVENFVEVKIPRERVIVGDINTSFRDDEEAEGFYRE